MASYDESTYYVTWCVLYVLGQKLLKGVEDSSIGNNNRGMDLNLLLSFKHCYTWHTCTYTHSVNPKEISSIAYYIVATVATSQGSVACSSMFYCSMHRQASRISKSYVRTYNIWTSLLFILGLASSTLQFRNKAAPLFPCLTILYNPEQIIHLCCLISTLLDRLSFNKCFCVRHPGLLKLLHSRVNWPQIFHHNAYACSTLFIFVALLLHNY